VDLRVGLDITKTPGYDPGILQPIVSHYNDYATLATHSELKGTKNYPTTPKKNQHHTYYLPLFLKQPSAEDD